MQCVQTNGALGCAHVQGIHKSGKLKKRLLSLARKLVQKAKCSRKSEPVYVLDNFIVCTGALNTRRNLPSLVRRIKMLVEQCGLPVGYIMVHSFFRPV